ncbi:MAG: hypothetical protein AB7P76_00295 [Candidatus Melainabacteria bacterium]
MNGFFSVTMPETTPLQFAGERSRKRRAAGLGFTVLSAAGVAHGLYNYGAHSAFGDTGAYVAAESPDTQRPYGQTQTRAYQEIFTGVPSQSDVDVLTRYHEDLGKTDAYASVSAWSEDQQPDTWLKVDAAATGVGVLGRLGVWLGLPWRRRRQQKAN